MAVWTEQLQQAVAPPSVTATVRVVRPEPQGNWLENLLGLNKPNPVPHKSAKGIDYRELEKLLKAKEWRSADELTMNHMLKVANREKKGWLDSDHIEAFPCEDLRTIDQLWVHYSDGKFGFSIQKKLWLKCGGEIGKYDDEVWKKFAVKVGWYDPQQEYGWRQYTDLMNNTKNAQNALPASLPTWGHFTFSIGYSFLDALAQTLVNCNR